MDNAKIQEAFKFLSNQELVGWDKGFVESVTEWFERHNGLSEKQYSLLAKIVEKFSPENLRAKEEWALEYRSNHIKNAKIIAKYYEGTGYFTALARDILFEDTFVPSRKQWKAVSENKSTVIEIFTERDKNPQQLEALAQKLMKCAFESS